MAMTIEKIPFFQDLSPKEISQVKLCLKEKKFSKGETVFGEGNSCERVFFVKEGQIKVFRMSAEGREQVLEVLKSGDTCACNPGEAKWRCSSSGVALASSTLWYLSRDHYVQLVNSNSQALHALNRLFADRLQCFSSLIEEVSLKDSRKRLTKFLLDMAKENAGSTLELQFSREELARRLGIVRETVARQLHQLKRLKLIDIKPGQVIIKDLKGLEKLL